MSAWRPDPAVGGAGSALLDTELMGSMPDGSVLVVTGRGAIVEAHAPRTRFVSEGEPGTVEQRLERGLLECTTGKNAPESNEWWTRPAG